jgi:hypothetical protein
MELAKKAMSPVEEPRASSFFDQRQLEEMKQQQRDRAILDNQLTIEKLKAQVASETAAKKIYYEREQKALKLLKALVDGLRSTDIEVPGYEDAMAFFVQEKMLNRGGEITVTETGDIDVSWSEEGKIFKL